MGDRTTDSQVIVTVITAWCSTTELYDLPVTQTNPTVYFKISNQTRIS